MLRNEKQIALNEVVVACKKAADVYDVCADRAQDPGMARLLREAAAERRMGLPGLEEWLQASGDLPREPDEDAETARGVLTSLKSALSPDERQSVVEDCERAEEELEQAIAVALRLDFDKPLRRTLKQIYGQAEAGRKRLKNLAPESS